MRIRAAIDTQVVGEYADAMMAGAEFPPIVLFDDGAHRYLADGFHRVLAARRLALVDLAVEIEPGTKAEALWFALGANRTNGMRLGQADKKHAILLALKAWPDRSTHQIAEQIGCIRATSVRLGAR